MVIKEFFQKKESKIFTTLFVTMMVVGIFFRTYHHHDLLRFNADQARDASIVSAVVEGKASPPLLGPKAGGTEFKLGPAFYYLQIVSAKFFGDTPDKMAYPDLFFSILAIPLLYFLLRKYFDLKTALALMAIFSVSVFAIKYSRFAWNPNSTPFWSMLFLYALMEIVAAEKQAWKWATIAGVAIGIGVQLHTLLLVFMPVMTAIVFGYLLFEKKKVFKSLFIIIAVAAVLNAAQIVSEYRSGGGNIKAFFGGVKTKNEKKSIIGNIFKDTICFAQGNTYMLSGANVSDTCETKSIDNLSGGTLSLLGLFIFVGGFAAGLRKLKQEKDRNKKIFLAIILSYVAIAFAVLIPLAGEISMRFFLVLIFMPFVLLGLCLEYIMEKIAGYKQSLIIVGVLVGILFVSNCLIASQNLIGQLRYAEAPGGSFDNVTLKEIELLSSFIVSHADSRPVVLDGSPKYVSRVIRPLQYMAGKSNVDILEQKTKAADSMIFYIGASNKKNNILKIMNVKDYASFGRLAIYQIAN